MINIHEVFETHDMIEKDNLDVRTITIGISLLDCATDSVDGTCARIREKILSLASDLRKTADDISAEFGIPIVNKRVSVTPVSLVGAGCCRTASDFVKIARTLDETAARIGVNFLGGFSAVVSKGMTAAERLCIESLPRVLASTERICCSVNVGSTKTGIDMDAVRLMGQIIKQTSELTADNDSMGCAKLVVLCNAPDDNPFMAGAFHGVTEGDAVINVGVSGPGVVKSALEKVRGTNFETLCETIKKTAFKITRVGQLVAKEASARLGIPFGIIDLSLAPTPAIGDSVADILKEIGLMTCVCSVGLDMIAIPGDTSAATISGIIADEAAIGMVNQKTTAVRIIPAAGKDVGDTLVFGGLLGEAPVMPVNRFGCEAFISREGRIPAPIHSFKN